MQHIEPILLFQENSIMNYNNILMANDILMQNEISNRLIVGDTIKNMSFFYVGLVLTLLGILPHYSYFATFFAIPYFMLHALFDFLGLFVSSVGIIIWVISAVLLFLWPMTVVFVVFWEIILIPLWIISPVTLTVGILLLYYSMA